MKKRIYSLTLLFITFIFPASYAEDGYRLWLRYEKVENPSLLKNYREAFSEVIVFNNDVINKIPGILNVQFRGLNNELLLKQLAPVIAASTGSACSSSKPSHVLEAVGLSLEEIRNTVRFSL